MNGKNIKSPTDVKPAQSGAIKGEGSYTATHNYDAGVRESVKKGNSEKLGRDAEKALDGAEGDELREAEAIGKRGNPAKI